MRLVIVIAAATAASATAATAAAVRLSRRGPRYAYGRWTEPDVGTARVGAGTDGP